MQLEYAFEGYWLSRRRGFSPATIAEYGNTFRQFSAFVGEREIAEVGTREVNAFLNQLTDRGLAPKTILNAWIALSSFWTWAEGELGIAHAIRGRVAMPKVRRPQIIPFTKDEVRRLLDACDYCNAWAPKHRRHVRGRRPTGLRDRAIVLMFLDSGIRVSELCELRLEDYDRKRGLATIHHGKGDKQRVVFLGEAARQAIWRYLSKRKDASPKDRLFATSAGTPLDRGDVLRLITRAGERSEVPNAHPHRFRHTFAILFLRNGGNLLALQDMLGHERLDTVRIYAHLAEVDLEKTQKMASPADNWRL